MTSLEGRVIRRRRAVAPPDGVRSELWIMAELARRLGAPGTWSLDPAEVFDELARASAGGPADYSGLSHRLLDDGEPAHWPYPPGSGGTPRLFRDGFAHRDGRARLVPVRPSGPAEEPARGELTLVTGRLLGHYQSGTQTRRVAELAESDPEPLLELHPETARRHGLGEGDSARVSNARGTVDATVRLSADIRPETVFLPFHFSGSQSANLLTGRRVDPISAMPEFKTAVVRIEPAGEPVG